MVQLWGLRGISRVEPSAVKGLVQKALRRYAEDKLKYGTRRPAFWRLFIDEKCHEVVDVTLIVNERGVLRKLSARRRVTRSLVPYRLRSMSRSVRLHVGGGRAAAAPALAHWRWLGWLTTPHSVGCQRGGQGAGSEEDAEPRGGSGAERALLLGLF